MTVNYSYAASTATSLTFWKLMAYWRGSIWKLVYREVLAWFMAYTVILLTFHLVIKDTVHEKPMLNFINYCKSGENSNEVTLILGFFTTLALLRFWEIYQCVQWPDNMALAISTYLKSDTETEPHVRVLRKTCARYIMLSLILVLRDVSSPIRNRFPTLRILVENGGLLTENELTLLEGSLLNFPGACKYWVPIIWMCNLLKKHFNEEAAIDRGKAIHRYAYNDLIVEILNFRSKVSDILSYDWVPIPLAYLQLCVASVYIRLLTLLFADQVTETDGLSGWDLVQPIVFSSVQLVMMLGWIKSAEVLLNPFGHDDDDLEISWLIDRHWLTVTKILDRPMINFPAINAATEASIHSAHLPHTVASRFLLKKKQPNPMVGSVAKMQVKRRDAQIVSRTTSAGTNSTTVYENPEMMP